MTPSKRARRDGAYLRKHPGQARVWRALVKLNEHGQYPTKLRLLEVAGNVDPVDVKVRDLRTYGGGYRMIDTLIASGWIRNRSRHAGVYQLEAVAMEGP